MKADQMNKSLLKELLELTPAERIELAEELWDSIEPAEMPPLTTEQKQEIERRYAEHVRNPDRGSSWEDVKTRLLARYR
jgi:putative addiction module component (TIGR02574 family)